MNRLLQNSLLGLGLASLSSLALAGDWQFMPVKNADYTPNVTVSLVGGQMKPTGAANGNYAGAEVAFNCLALQPPVGVIRSKISYGEYNKNGYKVSSFEVNPRWTTFHGDKLSLGIGPGIGYVSTTQAGQTANMFALQLGADLDYRIGALNLGLGVRWQGTENKAISAGVNNASNTLVQAKLGMNF